MFTQPELHWTSPRELALTSAEAVAQALSKVREQNPSAGLDASFAASYAAVVGAVYERFKGLPSVLKRYVQVTRGGAAQATQTVTMTASGKPRIKPIKAGGGGCASCGGARRLKKKL